MDSAPIETKIRQAVDSAVRQIANDDDSVGAAVGRGAHFHLLLNSSFLARDKRPVRTLQSQRRLLAELKPAGRRISAGTISVSDDRTTKLHYRVLSLQELPTLIPLRDALAEEVAAIGDLVFVLMGKVEGLHPYAQPVEAQAVKRLRLDPSLIADIGNDGADGYALKKVLPVEELLDHIGHELRQAGGLSASDKIAVAAAYEKMLDAATTRVTIPRGTVRPQETILGQIANALRVQTEEYRVALAALSATPQERTAQHEVLRIAYNFSTDVLPLVSLFMSVCDLKPLVFWCTIDKQWALHRAFAVLPWAAFGRKGSMDDYQSIVSGARNSAFHHLLPFEATLEVDLTDVDVRAETIRLFAPFGQKNGSGVRLRDQVLADVLAEFSRAKQRPVSLAFWRANLKLMEAACDLAQGILEALIAIHEVRSRP